MTDLKHSTARHLAAGGFGVPAEGCPRCAADGGYRRMDLNVRSERCPHGTVETETVRCRECALERARGK